MVLRCLLCHRRNHGPASTPLQLSWVYCPFSMFPFSLIPTFNCSAKLAPHVSWAQGTPPLRCPLSILDPDAALLILPGSCLSCPFCHALNMIV